MVIVKLQGGLGNQLFQYSVGRQLAIKNQTELKLDTYWYNTAPSDRPYELDSFTIRAGLADRAEINRLAGWLVRLRSLIQSKPSAVIKEQSLRFDPTVLNAGPNTYLDGFWQSERYFADAAPSIRRELTLKSPASGRNAELLDQISQTVAVAVHVRRGDYVSSQTFNNFHGTCSPEYYHRAVDYLAKRVRQPHFYVFSDDAAWAKAHLSFTGPATFIDHNGRQPAEDLRLMSCCQHFIIANSTFSWWGAWLAAHPKKIVIAPKIWFRARPEDAADLVPKAWVRL